MEFAQPVALFAALLAVPLLLLSWRRRRRALVLASTGRLGALRPTLRMRAARLLPLLRPLAVVLFALALAGPRIGDANAVVPGEGVDIAISLDISSSMTGANLGNNQTRLEATKDVVRQFIGTRENDRLGLVVFQRDALALSPPTLDYDALDTMVEDIESGIMPDGTGIGIGLAESVNMLRDSTAASRVVILLTDGQHNATSIPPPEAADLASALNITVYTIGVVTPGRSGEVDEELLTEIANSTGGRYFVADSPESLKAVYDEIASLETSSVGRERFERFTELAPWFLLPGIALLFADLLLSATWLRRSP